MKKILIVDDDLDIIATLEKVFTTTLKGYLVLTATSANAGLSMLKEQDPEVIVLDIRLGPKSGMDLLADYYGYLKDQKIQTKPRFIVITAYPTETVKKQALEEYRVDAFLIKPVVPSKIKNEVIKSFLRIAQSEVKILFSMLTEPEQELKEKKNVLIKEIEEKLNPS